MNNKGKIDMSRCTKCRMLQKYHQINEYSSKRVPSLRGIEAGEMREQGRKNKFQIQWRSVKRMVYSSAWTSARRCQKDPMSFFVGKRLNASSVLRSLADSSYSSLTPTGRLCRCESQNRNCCDHNLDRSGDGKCHPIGSFFTIQSIEVCIRKWHKALANKDMKL